MRNKRPRNQKDGAKSSAMRKFKLGKKIQEQRFERSAKQEKDEQAKAGVRLNKYIANAGICSRREADELISAGFVQINEKVVTELGTRVMPKDKVKYKGKEIKPEKNVYILMNKPKDFITTVDDPRGRKTVMDLVRNACSERVYPVGRLDRMTTGVLLLTNDGDLAKKLTHPSHEVRKIYQVRTAENLSKGDLVKLATGVELEDGEVKADDVAFIDDKFNEIGIEIHSGKNRVIRRMFEAIGHQVVKLDRVYFAGLTKKQLIRGKYRFLSPKEVQNLKMLGSKNPTK
jgi:23S rRNA pseudouridine2605 synthase